MRRLWQVLRRRRRTAAIASLLLTLAAIGWLRLGPAAAGSASTSPISRRRSSGTAMARRCMRREPCWAFARETLDTAALPASHRARDDGGRRRALRAASGHRSDWRRAGRVAKPSRGPGRRRRLDDHAAGRETADRPADEAGGRRADGAPRSTRRSSRSASNIGSTKNEILALYLTLAPYGNQIAGAERARARLLRSRRWRR